MTGLARAAAALLASSMATPVLPAMSDEVIPVPHFSSIGLRGDVMGTGSIGELIAASSPTDPGCNGGIVDQAGH